MPIRSYRDLDVWRKALDLTIESYRLSRRLPPDERFGLCSQMRRAAVSVTANIAEGHGRSHRGDYLHHLSIAHGSLTELETHFLIAKRLELLRPADVAVATALATDVGRMLSKLNFALRRSTTRPAPRAPSPESRAPAL